MLYFLVITRDSDLYLLLRIYFSYSSFLALHSYLTYTWICRTLSINKMNDGAANERERVALPAPPSLKIIKEMLRNNRIIQKKEVEMHKTHDIAET